MSSVDDLTAPARIRIAAIRVFARDGFSRATVRRVAQEAGVSPGLVIHHYGSKDALRQACDRHVLETAAREKTALLSARGHPLEEGYLTAHPEVAEQLAYLTRALQEGGTLADEWFDALVGHTTEMLALAERQGALTTSADPAARVIVLVTQSLASVLLRSQIARHLGADPLTDTATYDRLARVVTELQTQGLLSLGGSDDDA